MNLALGGLESFRSSEMQALLLPFFGLADRKGRGRGGKRGGGEKHWFPDGNVWTKGRLSDQRMEGVLKVVLHVLLCP